MSGDHDEIGSLAPESAETLTGLFLGLAVPGQEAMHEAGQARPGRLRLQRGATPHGVRGEQPRGPVGVADDRSELPRSVARQIEAVPPLIPGSP